MSWNRVECYVPIPCEAVSSGDWILKHDFSDYGNDTPPYGCHWLRDRYHYGAALCSQAMYQLGGKY